MADFTFEVKGLAEYERRLTELGTAGARRAGRKAMRQGANVILKESRRLSKMGHPMFPNVVTTRMSRSLRTRDRGFTGDTLTFTIDVTNAFYARFVEFGTSHARAYPFMRPAAENKANEAVATMAETLGPAIQLEWSRAK